MATDNDYLKRIGERIKKKRKEKKINQETLSNMLGYKGKSAVCNIESGYQNCSILLLKSIADCLEVPIEELISDK